MHEVVTLQFGQQANHLGTHYWNTQESYFTYAGQEESPIDHDISFRPGIGADGADTYTPRTVIYDLKGAFGTLRRENALYELQQRENPLQDGPWRGSTIPLSLPPIVSSSYQQALDQGTEPPRLTSETVRFWSDYNHLYYHPRSIVQLNEYELNSSLMPFEKWQTGEDLFMNLDREHDLLDRDVRPFLEECDQLQALQVFTGVDDAWGGFAARYLERVSDELGKGCRWVFGLNNTSSTTRERQALRHVNTAHSLCALNSSSSLHTPLSSVPHHPPPYLSLDSSSSWHTSALSALALESLTLPTRLRGSNGIRMTFDELERALNNDGNRRIAMTGLSADDPTHWGERNGENATQDARVTNGYSNHMTDGHDEDEESKSGVSLFPNSISSINNSGRRLGRKVYTFSTVESLRGAWKSVAEIQSSNELSRDRLFDGPKLTIYQSSLLFPLLSSFPPILRFDGRPQKVAVKAKLSTSTAVADHIRNLESLARRMVSVDEREALSAELLLIAEEYEEGWSESDGSDDND